MTLGTLLLQRQQYVTCQRAGECFLVALKTLHVLVWHMSKGASLNPALSQVGPVDLWHSVAVAAAYRVTLGAFGQKLPVLRPQAGVIAESFWITVKENPLLKVRKRVQAALTQALHLELHIDWTGGALRACLGLN